IRPSAPAGGLPTTEGRAAAERSRAPIVLASASPRRRAIMESLGLPFEVYATDVDETPSPGEAPGDTADRLAEGKARAAAVHFPDRIVVGADTVVALGSVSLGKPSSEAEAIQTLRTLRGRDHRVITAVAAARAHGARVQVWRRTAVAHVWMRDYSDAEIAAYVASGDPMDKAGSYAIQDESFHPVARFQGCYLTVVGLPLPELCEVIALAGGPTPSPKTRALRT